MLLAFKDTDLKNVCRYYFEIYLLARAQCDQRFGEICKVHGPDIMGHFMEGGLFDFKTGTSAFRIDHVQVDPLIAKALKSLTSQSKYVCPLLSDRGNDDDGQSSTAYTANRVFQSNQDNFTPGRVIMNGCSVLAPLKIGQKWPERVNLFQARAKARLH